MRRAESLQICTKLVVHLLLVSPSLADEPTNRDAAIQFFAESVGTECEQETIDKLRISKEQCDKRHVQSVNRCKLIAVVDLPPKLSQVELGRAMLRFSFCRGMLIQGESFDLDAWEPTITEMLKRAHDDD